MAFIWIWCCVVRECFLSEKLKKRNYYYYNAIFLYSFSTKILSVPLFLFVLCKMIAIVNWSQRNLSNGSKRNGIPISTDIRIRTHTLLGLIEVIVSLWLGFPFIFLGNLFWLSLWFVSATVFWSTPQMQYVRYTMR